MINCMFYLWFWFLLFAHLCNSCRPRLQEHVGGDCLTQPILKFEFFQTPILKDL